MPKFLVTEPLRPRQRKRREYEVQALNRDTAIKELSKQGVIEIESMVEIPPTLVDEITLKTARELNVGITAESTRLEAAISLLLRISDIDRTAELVIGMSPNGDPYHAYFHAFGVEDSPKGVRIKGMALVAPPDPEEYFAGQGEGVRKWLAEEIEQIQLAPESIQMPRSEEYGKLVFTVR